MRKYDTYLIVNEIMQSRAIMSKWHESQLLPIFDEAEKVDLYCAYSRWRQTESKVVCSRANIHVSIDIGMTNFIELQTQHSHLPLLYPGIKLKTPYGVTQLLVSSTIISLLGCKDKS